MDLGLHERLPALVRGAIRRIDRRGSRDALPLYRDLHPLLRWDSRTEFVQAIKLSMDIVGRHGGRAARPAWRSPEHEAEIRRLTERAVAAGLN